MVRKRFRVLILLVSVGLGGIALGLFFVRPFIRSDDYTVSVTVDGNPAVAELLQPWSMQKLYYIRLPDGVSRRYDWFGVSFARKSVFVGTPIHMGWGGIRYIHRDQAKGVRLTDGKIEDKWEVHFADDGVEFSNASLNVSVRRSP